eukprot:4523432-Pleurochrysis_carterae.AAC.2
MCRSVGLVLEKLDGFETRMIVNEHKKVLVPRVLRAHEGSSDVGVNESPRVSWFVVGRVMGVARSVSFRASATAAELAMSKRGRCVRSDRRQIS